MMHSSALSPFRKNTCAPCFRRLERALVPRAFAVWKGHLCPVLSPFGKGTCAPCFRRLEKGTCAPAIEGGQVRFLNDGPSEGGQVRFLNDEAIEGGQVRFLNDSAIEGHVSILNGSCVQ